MSSDERPWGHHVKVLKQMEFCALVIRSGPGVDVVPTFKTGNGRICLLLKTGQLGALRTEDAERLQVQHSNTHEASTCL